MAGNDKPDMAAVMATPEFQKAVEAAAAKAVTAAMAEVTKSAKPFGNGSDDATAAFFSQMALQIAEISDQGTNRKRVAPEILARREAARQRCGELITKARQSGLKPEYRVVSKVYFNERLIEPFRRNADKTVIAQEIIWTGWPNDALRPINEIATEIYRAYKDSIGSTERIATLDNRAVWMTPGGLVVKGDAPPKAFVAPNLEFGDDLRVGGDNNDPNAPTVHVLGTVAAPAKRNTADMGAAAPRG